MKASSDNGVYQRGGGSRFMLCYNRPSAGLLRPSTMNATRKIK
jgi:hypothetical protein